MNSIFDLMNLLYFSGSLYLSYLLWRFFMLYEHFFVEGVVFVEFSTSQGLVAFVSLTLLRIFMVISLCIFDYKIKMLLNVEHPFEKKFNKIVIDNELIQDLNDQLLFHKIKSVAIFGNGTKEQRKKALRSFSTGDAKILVASDLVARGLDLPAITHIINLDIPSDLNEYTHRAGRTGRAGKKGIAISIVTENEVQFIKQIEKKAGIKCMEIKLSNGYLIEAKPGK